MSKHTPGPWLYEMYSDDSNYALIYCHNSKTVGDNLRGYCGEPNARLIAAAPDLLEALEVMISAFHDTEGLYGSLENNALKYAAAVIAKAKGEI